MWKRKNKKRSTTIDSNTLTVEVLPLIKKEPKKAESEPRIPQNDLTEDNDFVETEVGTPKLNDKRRREVNLEGIIVKTTIVLKLTMRQSRRKCLNHQRMGVQENQPILTQTTKAEAQSYLRPKLPHSRSGIAWLQHPEGVKAKNFQIETRLLLRKMLPHGYN